MTALNSEAAVAGKTTGGAAAKRDREQGYTVKVVEKTQMDGAEKGQVWYRYVVANGTSTITGHRPGSLQQVTAHARQFAEQLNARARSTSPSVWAPRRKKA